MEAYLNELSLITYSTKKDFKSNLKIVAESLYKIKEWNISTIRVSPNFYTHHFLHNCLFNQLLDDKDIFPKEVNEKDDDYDDYDLKTLLTSSFGTLEPIDQIQDVHNVTSMTIGAESCYGLGLASEFLMNSATISFPHKDWNNDKYTVTIKFLDEEVEEFEIESNTNNISQKEQCETHRDFLSMQLKKDVRSGKELWTKCDELFPNIKFCENVYSQIKGIKGCSKELNQILNRLFDLQRVAASINNPINGSEFRYHTTPESESRINKLSKKLSFKCPDGEERLFSWHSRYTPGAGRIHFFPIENEKIFYVGYIGDKIL